MKDLAIKLGTTREFYEKPIIKLIEEQALNKIAVYYENKEYTYQDLINKSNSLAQELLGMGAQPQMIIPVFMRGGFKYIVSLLACLKLNCIFVPLDPAWPEERIKRLLDNLEFRFLLTDQKTQNGVYVDDAIKSAEPVSLLSKPTDLIYGLYTSGTTGEPKCALNYHKGVLNRLIYMNRRFGIKENDVILQNSSIAFDSSLWQIFWPLINGLSVVLPGSSGYNLIERLEIIERYKVTFTDFVPTIFNSLVNYLQYDKHDLKSLRTILIGGEEVSNRDVKLFKQYYPEVDLVNTYGHTENSIGSIFHSIQASEMNGKIPLGTPIDNTFALILDNEGGIAAKNTLGEIAIGGECLGAGYYKNDKQTAKAYIEVECGSLGRQRVYKTGDFGYLSGELLYFSGREDEQFKINGIRIDSQELTDSICRFEGVSQACLLLSGEKKFIICALVLRENTVFDQKKLQDILSDKFPKAILPKEYHIFPEFPTSHNGKLDKKAILAAINLKKKSINSDLLKGIWEQVLNRAISDEESDFFESGGDSLDVVRLACIINATYNIKVSVSELLENSTLKSQRNLIDTGFSQKKSFLPILEEDIKINLPRDILMIGGNGFIGIHILSEILKSDKTVHCIIRASTHQEAADKLIAAAKKYQLDNVINAPNIKIIPGDIAKEEVFEGLSVDTVYNCSGVVNFTADYAYHRGINVLALKNIIRFCHRTKAKLNHISTLSVFLNHGEVNISEETLPVLNGEEDGYNASKIAGELLCQEAKKQGVKINIFRVGEAMPHSKLSIRHEKSFAQGIHEFLMSERLVPGDIERYDYTPVDFIAWVIVFLQNNSAKDTFNIFNKEGICCSDLIAILKWEMCSTSDIILKLKASTKYNYIYDILLSSGKNIEEVFKKALSLTINKYSQENGGNPSAKNNIDAYLNFVHNTCTVCS